MEPLEILRQMNPLSVRLAIKYFTIEKYKKQGIEIYNVIPDWICDEIDHEVLKIFSDSKIGKDVIAYCD